MIYLPEHSPVGLDGKGIRSTVPKGTTKNIDIVVEQDILLKGGALYAKNSAWGDTFDAYVGVFDPQGNFIILSQWLTDWNIPAPDALGNAEALDLEADVLGQLYAGLVVRIVYRSVGVAADPETAPLVVAINFKRYRRL